MKYILSPLLILFTLFASSANAQRDTSVLYLDSALNIAPKARATIIEKVVRQDDGLWHTYIYKRDNNYKLVSGSYKERSLETEEGFFEYYNYNIVIMSGNFHDGYQSGVWQKWGRDGRLTDSVYFDAGKVVTQAKFQYHVNGHLWRYSMETTEKEKITRVYDTADVLISEGHFINNDGDMYIYYADGKVKSHSVYKGNQRTVYDLFDEQGHKYTEAEYLEMTKKNEAGKP